MGNTMKKTVFILSMLALITACNQQSTDQQATTEQSTDQQSIEEATSLTAESLFDVVEHHYVDNNGVNIHYVTQGEGEVILFVHGFPNWWYDWRNQMADLASDYKVVALDTRGYNKSDKPEEKNEYTFPHFISDVTAVINDLGVEKVTLVGHDWGGGISWRVAATHPELIEKLVIFNLTHPTSYMKVLNEGTPEQKANTAYIKQIHDSTEPAPFMVPEQLAERKGGSDVVKARHLAAYQNTSMNNILDYYRNLYPLFVSGEYGQLPRLQMPVLQFHGMNDRAVDKDGLRDTWNHIDNNYTLITLPGVGHDPHHEAIEIVNSTLRNWLETH